MKLPDEKTLPEDIRKVWMAAYDQSKLEGNSDITCRIIQRLSIASSEEPYFNTPVDIRINTYYNFKRKAEMKPKELIKMLKDKGWDIDRIDGLHYILKHQIEKGLIVVPYHNKDLKPGTLHGILKKAEMKKLC